MSNQKLQAAQSQVEAAGYRWKHLSVALHGDQTIAGVLESPSAWSALQTDRVRCLPKGDKVSIISADGLVRHFNGQRSSRSRQGFCDGSAKASPCIGQLTAQASA